MMIINLANAHKLSNNITEANKLLDKEDWSATGRDFQVCVHAIRGEVDELLSTMKSIGKSGDIQAEDYQNWPVFRGIRSNDKFKEMFEEIFQIPLLPLKLVTINKPDEGSCSANFQMAAREQSNGNRLIF